MRTRQGNLSDLITENLGAVIFIVVLFVLSVFLMGLHESFLEFIRTAEVPDISFQRWLEVLQG